MTGQPQWPLRAEEKWINKYSSCSVCVYSTAWVSRHACVCLCLLCVWQTSLSRPVCLVQVLRCDNSSAPLLSSLLAWLSLLIQRATDGKLVSASRVSSLELIQQKHSVWILGAHSMGSLNLFAIADSSTLQYGVDIKMTNRGRGSPNCERTELLAGGLHAPPEWN